MFYVFTFIASEVLSLVWGARLLGGLNVFFLVLLCGAFGLWLVANQGWMTMYRLRAEAVGGRPLEKALLRSLVVLFAGLLLMSPGFFSDFLALVLLFPLTGNWAAKALQRKFVAGVAKGRTQFFWTNTGPFQRGPFTQNPFEQGFGPQDSSHQRPFSPYDSGFPGTGERPVRDVTPVKIEQIPAKKEPKD
jgi:UPF0716 protein FxsA